jgi:hypothetical protein
MGSFFVLNNLIMAKFLATRQVIYREEAIIEAANEEEAQKVLIKAMGNLEWGEKEFIDYDYYEIDSEIL